MKKLKSGIWALLFAGMAAQITPQISASDSGYGWSGWLPQSRSTQAMIAIPLIAAAIGWYKREAIQKALASQTAYLRWPFSQPKTPLAVKDFEELASNKKDLKEIKISALKKHLEGYEKTLSNKKKLHDARIYIEKTINKEIDKLLKKYGLSEHNKQLLEWLSLATLEPTQKESTQENIEEFKKTMIQTINDIK